MNGTGGKQSGVVIGVYQCRSAGYRGCEGCARALPSRGRIQREAEIGIQVSADWSSQPDRVVGGASDLPDVVELVFREAT